MVWIELRDKRIEKLEKALLLVLSLGIGNHADPSSKKYLNKVSTFVVERAETLVTEGGSTENAIQELLDISKKKRGDEEILGRR